MLFTTAEICTTGLGADSFLGEELSVSCFWQIHEESVSVTCWFSFNDSPSPIAAEVESLCADVFCGWASEEPAVVGGGVCSIEICALDSSISAG